MTCSFVTKKTKSLAMTARSVIDGQMGKEFFFVVSQEKRQLRIIVSMDDRVREVRFSVDFLGEHPILKLAPMEAHALASRATGAADFAEIDYEATMTAIVDEVTRLHETGKLSSTTLSIALDNLLQLDDSEEGLQAAREYLAFDGIWVDVDMHIRLRPSCDEIIFWENAWPGIKIHLRRLLTQVEYN
ncbi:hypothetical protein ACYPKM_01835 [Pseudomonas aeruginosa]